MSETKHTPGPWSVEFNNPLSPIEGHTVRVATYPHRGLCIVPKGGGTHGVEHQEANARLIAAAPDLLAACQAADRIELIRDSMSECYARLKDRHRITVESQRITQAELDRLKTELRSIRQQIRSAIAKATSSERIREPAKVMHLCKSCRTEHDADKDHDCGGPGSEPSTAPAVSAGGGA